MKKSRILTIVILFIEFFTVSGLFAQNKAVVDSLLIEWETERKVENKVVISKALFDELAKGDYGKAMDFAKWELIESEISDSPKMKIYAFNHIAIVYNETGNFDSADFYINKALDLCEQNDLEYEKQITYLNIGRIYNDNFLVNKSSTYVFKALNYFEETNNNKYLANAFNLIGLSYLRQERLEQSLEFINKAFDLSKSINDKEALANSYNTLGSLFLYKNDLEKAIPLLEKALKIGKETYNNNLNTTIYYNLALAYQVKDDFDVAKLYILKAIKLDQNSNSQKNLAYDYNLLGSLYIDSDSLTKAKYYIEKAYNSGKEINDIVIIYNSLYDLIDLSSKNKNYKKAYEYQKMIQAMDTLLPQDKSKDIAQLEMQYELEKQEQTNKLEQQKRKYQNIILIGSLILGLIVISLLYFVKSGKAKKSKLEKGLLQEKLEQKNKELTTYVMYLVKKNELISSISQQLIKVKLNVANADNKIVLDGLINEMKTNIKDDDTWKEFEIRFQEVHAGFYNKLASKHPALSVNERRLAAFLKLNMTTKEISAITYQSITAIEVARTRLRKKLGIANSETNLVSFFAQV